MTPDHLSTTPEGAGRRSAEYRVRWRRDFHSGDQTRIYQTRKAAERRALLIQGRMAEATGDDPEDFACGHCHCPIRGDDVACRELTKAEVWAERGASIPPLVFGPVIEEREVGAWRIAGAQP